MYDHQILVSLLSYDELVLHIYDKDAISKIDLFQNLLKLLPKSENKDYALCDS